MPYVLQACSACGEQFEPPDAVATRTPHALPCGHVVCLPCARRPTLTPATSMSICGLCHVPYTKRDIYALKATYSTGTMNSESRLSPAPNAKMSESRIVSRHEKHYVSQGAYLDNQSQQALRGRIQELESTLAARDGQVRNWRKQFDKNAQALLMHVREVRELKKEVLEWWRRFEAKDLEFEALRRASMNQLNHFRSLAPRPRPPTHSKLLNGSRIVTYEMAGPPTGFPSPSTPPPYS